MLWRDKKRRVPIYLRKEWQENIWRRLIRFRMNNEMRRARYWEIEKKKMCRLCEGGEEAWEHVLRECMGGEEGGN